MSVYFFRWTAYRLISYFRIHKHIHMQKTKEKNIYRNARTYLHKEITMYPGRLITLDSRPYWLSNICKLNWILKYAEAPLAWQQHTVMIFHEVWTVINFTFSCPVLTYSTVCILSTFQPCALLSPSLANPTPAKPPSVNKGVWSDNRRVGRRCIDSERESMLCKCHTSPRAH